MLAERIATHIAWSAKVQASIAEDYERLHLAAQEDPQRAGHGGESSWARVLTDWLPPSYEVGLRKYIVPEVGDDTFETDLIIFHPSYPQALRGREEVLASGIAAAFSVKLTLDQAGLQDACERSARIVRGMVERRHDRADGYASAPFPVGLLAHSHAWKAPASAPVDNIYNGLAFAQRQVATNARELMEFVCVADLAFFGPWGAPWSRSPAHAFIVSPHDAYLRRRPSQMFPPEFPQPHLQDDERIPPRAIVEGLYFGMGHMHHGLEGGRSNPIAAFVSNLFDRLALNDESLRPIADGLRLLQSADGTTGSLYQWPLDDVIPVSFQRRTRIGRFSPGQDVASRTMYVQAKQAETRAVLLRLQAQREDSGSGN